MSAYNILLDHERERAARVAPNPYRLTRREMHVAAWVGRGLDCAEIAGKLGIQTRSVSGHLKRISDKLHARNAVHLGLIINTMPGLPVEQPNVVAIEDFREAFGMGWKSAPAKPDVVFAD
jgi:DNA-binding CsgD family transcriptional regulator